MMGEYQGKQCDGQEKKGEENEEKCGTERR
jgi:hypothetical protein